MSQQQQQPWGQPVYTIPNNQYPVPNQVVNHPPLSGSYIASPSLGYPVPVQHVPIQHVPVQHAQPVHLNAYPTQGLVHHVGQPVNYTTIQHPLITTSISAMPLSSSHILSATPVPVYGQSLGTSHVLLAPPQQSQVNNSAYNSFWDGLKPEVLAEIKANIETRDPNFGLELRRHVDSVLRADPIHRKDLVYDTLNRFHLVSQQRLAEPAKLWEDPNSSAFKTPERQSETWKNRDSHVSRQSVLSPYRNSSYPEFELVEDLPDRSNLIDSINLFLQKSPVREKLLTSPARVSIQRQSLLSPARIDVESLLKEKAEDGSIYEGEGKDGVRHGRGKITFPDGRSFEGIFENGKPVKGLYRYKSGKAEYEGEVSDNQFEGKGLHFCDTPLPIQGNVDFRDLNSLGNTWVKYEGDFKNGKRHGNGTLFLTNGERWTGEWKDNVAHGEGKYFRYDGSFAEGKWENGVLKSN